MNEPNPNNAPEGARAWNQGQTNQVNNQTTSPMPSINANAIGNCSACEYGAPRDGGSRRHGGVDIVAPNGTVVVAPIGGRVKYASSDWYTSTSGGSSGRAMVGIVSDYASGGFPAGTLFASGHMDTMDVSVGTRVEPGTRLGTIGTLGGSDHNHFYIFDYRKPPMDVPGDQNGNVDPTPWVTAVMNGESVPTTGASSSSPSLGGGLNESTAKAAAFATYFHIDGLTERLQSDLLTGEHSLMNDRPLFPFIQQLCAASLRRFQSLPNGDFFAFYPDYFGGANHRAPYWEINDTEIIDGQIELSDDALATHVFIVGDTSEVSFFNGIDLIDEINSVGAVNLFNAFQANFITGHSNQKRPKDKMIVEDLVNAEAFLNKYGARPFYDDAPMVRSTFFEAFLAYQKFCLLWSQQFATTFNLTFMPEIFPGGLVKFPQHNLQLFVEEVSHTFDMETGFSTDVVFSAPASLDKKGTVHEGMIRSGALKGR